MTRTASAAVPVRTPSPATALATSEADYVDATVRVWLGMRAQDGATPHLPDGLARLLLRSEEYERDERDPWGCWDFRQSENFSGDRLREPEIDIWVAQQRAELELTTALAPLWPRPYRFAFCLTHDVDLLGANSTVRQAGRYARAGFARGLPGRFEPVLRLARPPSRIARSLRRGIVHAPSLHETLERSMELELSHGAVASYFFTVPPWGLRSRYDCVYAPHDICTFRNSRMTVADLMRALAAEGMDIGLHGSYESAFALGALTSERKVIEDALGGSVTTTRQHFLRWNVRTTPGLQEDAGLRADSTLGFNANVGFRSGTSLPFHHFDVERARTLSLLEVPLVIQDTAMLGRGGLDLEPDDAFDVVRGLVDVAAKIGGATTLLVHPDKLTQPQWAELYESILDHARAQGGWLTSLSLLDEWWRRREARLLAA